MAGLSVHGRPYSFHSIQNVISCHFYKTETHKIHCDSLQSTLNLTISDLQIVSDLSRETSDMSNSNSQSYAEKHKRITAAPVYSASEYARRVTDSAAASSGRRVVNSLDAIADTLQLSTMVAGSYIDDSKGLFILAQKLADRVSAVEKALGRPVDLPRFVQGSAVTSAERNRYTAEILQAAMGSLEGCLEGYTLIGKQQAGALAAIGTLTSSAVSFQRQVENDKEEVQENGPDDRIKQLVTDYVSVVTTVEKAHTKLNTISKGETPD